MQDGDYVVLDGAIKEIMAGRVEASAVFHLARELLVPDTDSLSCRSNCRHSQPQHKAR